MATKEPWPEKLKIWESYYLQRMPVDRIRHMGEQPENNKQRPSYSWETVRNVIAEFSLLTQAQAMALPDRLKAQWTELMSAIQGHRQAVRKITLRLKEELTVGLPGTNMERPHLQRLSDGKFELRLEVEDDPLLEAFKGHSPSDTFFEKFAQWKQLVAGSWQAYDALNRELMERTETIARKWLGPNPWGTWVDDEPKLMPSFPLIILRDIVKHALAREQGGNQPEPVIKPDDYHTETLRSGLVRIWSKRSSHCLP